MSVSVEICVCYALLLSLKAQSVFAVDSPSPKTSEDGITGPMVHKHSNTQKHPLHRANAEEEDRKFEIQKYK
jgi:hypothetical protein